MNRKLAAASQNQALNALVFLYREVLKIELEGIDAISNMLAATIKLTHKGARAACAMGPAPGGRWNAPAFLAWPVFLGMVAAHERNEPGFLAGTQRVGAGGPGDKGLQRGRSGLAP